MTKEIPSLEQIKRLEALQGIDSGVFTLAVFSVFEAYLRDVLDEMDGKAKFWELINTFRNCCPVKSQKAYQLLRNIQNNQKNTNYVRHEFRNLSVEEANSAAYLLNEFAKTFNIPNKNEIIKLMNCVEIWNARKSPAETARELERANLELKRLSLLNADMAAKVEDAEDKKKQLDLLDAKLKTLQSDYEEQIAKNKQNKEKIDELRRKKYDAEQENRKAQKAVQKQLLQLSDAQEYISNLSRMTSYTRTRYDYEQSLVHLTKEQESIVNMIKFDRDFLIKGSAGTGKSLVLLKAFEKLVDKNKSSLFDGNKTIKLITFSRSLEKYNKYIAALMSIENPPEGEFILTSESYAAKILKNAFPENTFEYGISKCLENDDEMKNNPLSSGIWIEIEKFILPKCVTKSEYCDEKIARTGMRKAQSAENRKKIWNAVEAIFAEWDKSKKLSVEYAAYKLAVMIKNEEYEIPDELKTDFLFVDEAQDLTAATLRILRKSVRESMILAGDNDQSVFQPGFTWSRAGIDITGHTRTLNTNFRCTNQINEVAEKYRLLIKGADKENCPETFRFGPPVELHEGKTQDASFNQILNAVKMCRNSLNYEPENICLIAPKRDQLQKLQVLLKRELDLESDFVNSANFDFSKQGIVRLATTQSCKGLDFPVVLFYLDHRAHFLDVFDDDVADKMNRNMIYTALTRSIELLHVFMPEKCSEGPLGDLKAILK